MAFTMPEKQEIVRQVELYYLQLNVNDSLLAKINEMTRLKMVDHDAVKKEREQKDWNRQNVHDMESELSNRVENAILLMAMNMTDEFANTMIQLPRIAITVDSLKDTRYWTPFIERIKLISNKNAIAWLKAQEAYLLCKQYHDQDLYWRDAEQYAAISLRQLKLFRDERLRLDVLHRLQFIIQRFRSMHELALTMAEINSRTAESVGYYLRSASMQFHMAWTLYDQGEIAKSFDVNNALLSFIEEYQNVPSMDWYRKECSILVAILYWQLGEYENGLAICQAFLKQNLNLDQQYRIANTQALLFRAMGKYELAEKQYKAALTLADSLNALNNKISILGNLGYLFEQLTEYDRAIIYYTKAKDLLEKSNPENLEDRANTLLNLLNAMIKNGEQEGLEDLTDETINIIEQLGNAPGSQSELWMSLGQIHMDLKKPEKALPYFQRAILICDKKEMVHIGLQNKILLSQCILQMGDYENATALLDQVLTLSEENNAIERFIDAKALQSEIQFQQANIDRAIDISNTLIDKIDEISTSFENSHRLYAYRQKIYDYIKRAVYYEIKNNQLDQAYAKLNYAKQRTFSSNQNKSNFQNSYSLRQTSPINQMEEFNSNSPLKIITLDYMLTNDSLYVFLLYNKNLQILKKGIDRPELERNVAALHSNILSTIKVLNEYQIEIMRDHYKTSKLLGMYLYDELMDSFGISQYLDRAEYLCVIADEFLYDIPFSALVVGTADGETYLADKITLLNNSGFGTVIKEKDTDITNKRVLISADTNIPGIEELVSFVKSYYQNTTGLYVDNDFSKEDVIKTLGQKYDIYIFIGHARANNIYPELSEIELMASSKSTDERQKVTLSISDLKRGNWDSAEMIMLIGCETGSGKRYRSAGIASIQQSLSSLGAKNVLGTMWEIDAGQAVDHIKDFVRFWAETADPALALRRTQQNALKNLSQHTFFQEPFPYLWSGYILSYNQYN
jgi:tetratricopeptide (TPR) repeat protein